MVTLTDADLKEIKSTETLLGEEVVVYRIDKLRDKGVDLDAMPYSIRVLLENVVRNYDGFLVTIEDVNTVANWPHGTAEKDVPYMPARVVLQDFTGVPLIVDLAAMRDAMAAEGGDPEKINPLIPTDLVIDHSVQVDSFGSNDSLQINLNLEYDRNQERYELIKWAQKAFKNFRVVPPGSGIVHQVNLEYLAKVIDVREFKGEKTAVIDSVVGTDSHTPMVNGLGVMGWGVGGIEAEAVMLGQPYSMLLPEVIGVRLSGQLPEGSTATDMVLTVVEMLRKEGVVGKFVEFFGSGLSDLSVPDKATISNMAPEYGATMGFFPVEKSTLEYMELTGREPGHIEFVKEYSQLVGIYRTDDLPEPTFTKVLELDLTTVRPSISGPLNPEERVSLVLAEERAIEFQEAHISDRSSDAELRTATFDYNGQQIELKDGNLVIAAITSCTNTSNPSVLIGAGLVAKKAVEKGLMSKPYVKTSFAPGSLVVTKYMQNLGLEEYLEKLGFHTVGYGCTTCIGNSGPLPPQIDAAIRENDLYVTSVTSGNRNFAGRVHQLTRGNFLASPMLVVAYALAGRTDINLTEFCFGQDQDGNDIFLKDLWPNQAEINEAVIKGLNPEMYRSNYATILEGDFKWRRLEVEASTLFPWKSDSTYIRLPPFFDSFTRDPPSSINIANAHVLMLLDDKISTDHISPAGVIAKDSPAAEYLMSHGVNRKDFNSYGSRRGNHEVMMRGTFANIRVQNMMVEGKDGWWSRYVPTGEVMSTFDTSRKYIENKIPVIGMAASQYGQGSSRDWAAKGPALLGMKAVIFKSIERIHRSNLIGMGVLPLQFKKGEGWRELGLDGSEQFSISGIDSGLAIGKELHVTATKADGTSITFSVTARIDTEVEISYLRFGGILQYVLANLLN
ncbi:MAG: aconitate hydratase AcnA [Candidatus Kariarchaeaceae archaeon]